MFASSKGTPSGKGPAKSKGPAWLGAASGKGSKKAAAGWKPSAPKQTDPESNQRAARVFVAVAAVVLLAGFLYYLLTRPQATPLIAFRAAAYPLQMPPLALAAEDEVLLTNISPQNIRVMPVELTTASAGLENLKKSLATASRRFNPLQRGAKVALVYVAAHGVVDEQNRACLMPPDGDPFNSQTWLPLADVLKAISEDAGLKRRDKLLVLDCQRAGTCWRSGWLENRFFEEMAAAVKAQADPHLFVLSSAAHGQIACAAPELRGSVFGHFLARGLRGDAIQSGHSVSLAQLFQYVAIQTQNYAQARRGVAQEPTLLHLADVIRLGAEDAASPGKGNGSLKANMPLCYVDRAQAQRKLAELQSEFDVLADFKKTVGTISGNTATNAAQAEVQASATLTSVWTAYEQRRSPGRATSDSEAEHLPGYVLDPVAWSSIQQRLAAIGERLLAGRQYQTPQLQAEIDRLAKDLADDSQWQPHGSVPGLNLLQSRVSKSDGVRRTGANAFVAYSKTEPEKRRESLPRDLGRVRAVRDVIAALTTENLAGDARSQLALAAEFLQQAAPVEASADLIEGHFINLLDRGLAKDSVLSPTALSGVLLARQAGEKAASPADVRIHYAVEGLVAAADERRRQGEDAIYLQPSDDAGRGAANVYDEALTRGRRMSDFLRLRDEVWSELPLIAEWHVALANFARQPVPASRLASALQRAIELDDAVERVLRTREESSTFAAPLDRCQTIFDQLTALWQTLRSELAEVYDRPTTVERAYRRPEDLRNAELALRSPPLTSELGQFVERYLETLADTRVANPTGATTPASQTPSTSAELFRELHRSLDYEFVDPYEQHRHSTLWDEKRPADVIFRTGDRTNVSAWEHIKVLLDQYNQAIAAEPLVWSRNQPAYGASARLRQWDRRVRVASAWLSSFQPQLRRPGQPTPARWLQEYDAAHLTAWHAYRALGDFWGNGEANATGGTPFFAAAIGRCDSVLPQRLRPIQYDVPGGSLADFAEQGPASLEALRAWDPIDFPRSFNVSASVDNQTRLDLSVKPSDLQNLRLPAGTAALTLVPAAGAPRTPRIAFDAGGQKLAEAIPLPFAGGRPQTTTALIERAEGSSGSDAAKLDARLWYRGHVKLKPCPLDASPSQYVEYALDRPRYAAPTVEVRGKDTLRGAVLFVFDCSTSMRGPSFDKAQADLVEILSELYRDAGDALKVGLMVYGTQTDIRDPQAARRTPHPDRDLRTLVSVKDGTAQLALAQLKALQAENCVGTTPLYYSLKEAIGAILADAADQPARRVIVISDGVNMPFDTRRDATLGYAMNPSGDQVNSGDYTALRQMLKRSEGQVQVTLQLFGARQSRFEDAQLKALVNLDEEQANFEVKLVDSVLIAESIRKSLPKTQIELRAERGMAAAQPLVFNQPQAVRDWDSTGYLRREHLRRAVRLALPGEDRSIEKSVDLLGGERVVLSYDAGSARLTFDDDGLTRRGTGSVAAPRGSDSLKLFFDALDPERVGAAVRKLRFRIRDEERAARLAPRPRHVWFEVRPRGAGDMAQVFPCLDAAWLDNINLPRLEVPVERWPDAPSARVQAYFRYDDPAAVQKVNVPRDSGGQTVTIEKDAWRVENVMGDADSIRKVVVIWQPTGGEAGMDKLLERGVWVSPPPDQTRRRYAVDGSEVIHEFTYTQAELIKRDVEVSVVNKSDFQRGAYSAEFEFDVAN